MVYNRHQEQEAAMETMTIGRLAKEARVNIDTLRYYEKRGLLPEPPRKESGYRMYRAYA